MAITEEIQAGVVLADRYRVRDRLGEGGMATVFLAEDCVLGRDVAIKRLRTEGSEMDRQRFRREARIGASLIHPNLVTIFDTLSGADGVLIVMEYVRGRPLADLIGPQGMDPRRLLEILRPVASALDHAHEHGVVHRDVKPANVLIAEDRRVKLVDLGTATASHMTQITSENEVVGTLAYIAPERLAAESVGEPAADVYSLAVLAFEALTGSKPYRTEGPAELLEEAGAGVPPDLREVWPEAPPRLARALIQGMDPDPDRRQRSAGSLVRELDAAVAGPGAAAAPLPFDRTEPMTPPTAYEPSASEPPPPQLQPSRARARWLIPALVAICALLAIGGWLAFSGGGGNGGPAPGSKRASGPAEDGSRASAAPSTSGTPSAPAATPAAAPPAATGTAVGSHGAQLNAEGYSLIQQGRYDEAIPVLRRAVASFPPGTTDLNYAYALFNLGHTLRLAGRPQEAIPILERRLQIPDQTETVQRELDAARADAGQ